MPNSGLSSTTAVGRKQPPANLPLGVACGDPLEKRVCLAEIDHRDTDLRWLDPARLRARHGAIHSRASSIPMTKCMPCAGTSWHATVRVTCAGCGSQGRACIKSCPRSETLGRGINKLSATFTQCVLQRRLIVYLLVDFKCLIETGANHAYA